MFVALGAAAIALTASFVAAVGPARGESAEYVWPPADLPAGATGRGWYTPLLLLNRVPSSIHVDLPCDLAPPLNGHVAAAVVATERRPSQNGGLRLALQRGAIDVSVGGRLLASAPWPRSCPLQVEIRDGEVRLAARVTRFKTATPNDMPVVTGLFSELDLRRGEAPQVVVRTRTYATSQTRTQVLAALIAVTLALGVFLAMTLPSRRAVRADVRSRLRAAWRARNATDAVVVGVLLLWWVIAPVFYDDGWLWVESHVLARFGIDTIYFNNWGLSFPIGYWIIWLSQWVVGSTEQLVFMRMPVLIVLLATWFLCRWLLYRVLPREPRASVRWMLATTYLVGACAWLMTLRLEPYISLLALVCLAAMVCFARAPGLAPLAIAVPAAVLSVSIHPVGIVAIAPMLAALLPVGRWLRQEGGRVMIAVVALLVAGAAIGLVLVTADADLATRLDAANILSQENLHNEPFWREYRRYTFFNEFGGDTAVRHLSLAVLGLSLLAVLTRRRRIKTGISELPARAVAIGLVLFAFIGSKWPWHFGTLVAMGAVAAAAEAARLLAEDEQRPRASVRPSVAMTLVAAAALWSWDAVGPWSPIDLQEARWDQVFGLGGRPWWIAALLVAGGVMLIARTLKPIANRMAVIAAGTLAVVSAAVLAATGAVLIGDAAVSPWTPARQNLETLTGRESCGLAHQFRGEPGLADRIADPNTPTLLVSPVGTFFPCATIPAVTGGLVQTPKLVIHHGDPWPLVSPDAPFAAVPDLYEVRKVASGGGAHVLAVDERIPGYRLAEAVRTR